MTRTVGRHRALLLLTAMLGTLAAGCGTVQQFDPAPEHLKTVEGTSVVPPAVTGMPSPPAPVPRAPQETYSVVVTDVPVRDVLFALARDAGVNVDVAGDIQGNVTINAINQTLPQILDRISRQTSIRYSINDGTLIVQPDSPYWQYYRIDYVNLARTSEGEVSVATQIATPGGSVGNSQGSGAGNGGSGGENEGNGSKTKVKSLSDNSFWAVLTPICGSWSPAKARAPTGSGEGDDPIVVNPIGGMVSVRGTSQQHQQVRPISTSCRPTRSGRC